MAAVTPSAGMRAFFAVLRATPVLALSVVIAAILALHWNVAAEMIAIWNRSDTFAHGFLVVPVVLWLVWRARGELAQVPARPSWWGIALLAGASFGWLLAELGSVAVVEQFGLVGMLVAAVLAVCGFRVAYQVAFPLAFMLFAVPAGEFLVPWLVDRTADFTVAALRSSGIPVYREANNFVIPSGEWSVVEACSGIRYLIASLFGGSLFAYLYYRSAWRRVAVIVAAAVIPLVANWLRAYLIVLLGHLSNNNLASGVDHLIYGWVFFGLVMFLFFWIASKWRDDDAIASPGALSPAHGTATASPRTARMATILVSVVAAIGIAGAFRGAQTLIDARVTKDAFELRTPSAMNGWEAHPASQSIWRPQFGGMSAEAQQQFTKGASTVGLFVAFYRGQHAGAELVNSENVLIPLTGSPWRYTALDGRTVPWGQDSIQARTADIRAGDRRLRVRYWYWVDDTWITSDARAKLLLAWSKLRGRGDDSAAIVIFTELSDPGTEADATLDAFSRDAAPAIRAMLREPLVDRDSRLP